MALVTVEEYQARQTEIRSRLTEIDSEFAGQGFPEDIRSEWNELNTELDNNETTISELEARRARLEEVSGDTRRREQGAEFNVQRSGVARGEDIYDLASVRTSALSHEHAKNEMRDRAMRSLERAQFPHPDAAGAASKEHVERLLQTADNEQGDLARHMLATGSPTYQRAFEKQMHGRPLSSDEQRALSVGTGSEGGFAVPYQLDPTIIPTSNGAVNPYRRISRVETIVNSNTWKGVSSDGVTATRRAEGAEAADNAPSLAQPSVTVQRVDSFIPYSFEAGQDWGGLQASMAKLFQDAKDKEEASSFTVGNGTPPNAEGIVTGATDVVETATIATFAKGDLYALEEDLGPRFRSLARFLGARSIYNKARQFSDEEGGDDVWVRLAAGLNANRVGNTGAELIGYPADEVSEMDSTVAAGNEILVFGDFEYFLIVDRIGMTVETVPHLFGANRRPTGQRGLFAYWRNNSKVLSANAFRTLKVKAA
jgi:HK97 family phage major capsid protein